MSKTAATAYHIQFILMDHMLTTSVALPSEMLAAAANVAKGKRQARNIQITTLAHHRRPLLSSGVIQPVAQTTFAKQTPGDLIFIPALWRNPLRVVQTNPEVVLWLQMAAQAGATLVGVGTGCFFLAAAGLLDGKPATTHWHFFDSFERHFPQVKLKRDYFITQTDRIYCAASINSLADLTVHFIQDLYDKGVAHHIERHFSHEIRRDYDSMRYFEGRSDQHSDETILQIQLWLQDHYAENIALSDLATRFDMSVRSFNRRFKVATGKSPLSYLQDLRMATARELLQTSNLSVGEIAYKVGYQDLGHFCALFKKHYHATPQDYRTTVRAKLFQVG